MKFVMQDQSLDLDNGNGLGIFKNPSQSGFKNDNGLAIVDPMQLTF